MTQQEFVNLLEEVLLEKKHEKRSKRLGNAASLYAEPYDNMYNTCLLGYEISHAKETYKEHTFNFKIVNNGKADIEASEHLMLAVKKLVILYGKREVAKVLKDM